MSREIKFRAWHAVNKIMIENKNLSVGLKNIKNNTDFKYMQFTGELDKNGVDIYENDLLNIYFTSSDGEHIHDCIYKVEINPIYGIQLTFVSLLWSDAGHNQYPTSTELSSRYNTLGGDHRDASFDRLAVFDSWGRNELLQHKWKGNDYSNYLEVIGNIYENPELLKGKP